MCALVTNESAVSEFNNALRIYNNESAVSEINNALRIYNDHISYVTLKWNIDMPQHF